MKLLLWSCLAGTGLSDFAPPKYTVDLDVDPEHRWDHIVVEQKDKFKAAIDSVLNSKRVKPLVPTAKLLIGNWLEARRILGTEQYHEIQGVARGVGVEASEIVLLASFYDLFAADTSPFKQNACAGILAQTPSGEIYHGRNLDYDFKDAIGPIALDVNFIRNNRTVFQAITFGPNPTFDTVVRYGSFSITQNERDTGDVTENMLDLIVKGRIATFAAIRKAAETLDTFESAVDYFSNVPLAASAYYIIGGVKPQEGAIITRNREKAVNVWRLNPAQGDWYILQLNSDHWKPAPFGDDRRTPLQQYLNATGQSNIGADSLWGALSIQHVNHTAGQRAPYNSMTIYTTVMQASNPATFKTLVRLNKAEESTVVV